MEFKVDIEADFMKLIRESKKDAERVVQSAFRKTASDIEKKIHNVLVSNRLLNIDIKDFRKTKTFVKKADLSGGVGNMSVDITVNAKPHTSFRFWPKFRMKGKKKIWFGYILGKKQDFFGGQAFVVPGKKPLFVRTGKDRFPLMPAFGPNAVTLLERTNKVPVINEFAAETLNKRLQEGLKDDFPLLK